MIKSQSLKKQIGEKEILRNISLNIKKGHIYGLVGKNGAGKTTLINCLTGIFMIDDGVIRVDNENPYDNVRIKQNVSYIPDEYPFPLNLNAQQIIKRFMNAYDSFDIEIYKNIINRFQLDDAIIGRNLSKGMRTQLMLALKLAAKPKILFMDEPTNGLDPLNQKIFFEVLIELITNHEITVFISSHYLEGIEKLCDVIGVLHNGELILEDDIDELKSKYFSIKSNTPLKNLGSAIRLKSSNNEYRYICKSIPDSIDKGFNKVEKLYLSDVVTELMKGVES